MKALLLILASASIAHAAELHTVDSGCQAWHKGSLIELRATQACRFSFPVPRAGADPTENLSGQLQAWFADPHKLQSFTIELDRKDSIGTSHIGAMCLGAAWAPIGQTHPSASYCGFLPGTWHPIGLTGHTNGQTFAEDTGTVEGLTTFFYGAQQKAPGTGDDLTLVLTLTPQPDATVYAAVRDVQASQ
jgi:hypothetical protein